MAKIIVMAGRRRGLPDAEAPEGRGPLAAGLRLLRVDHSSDRSVLR